jgi:hypothetical protein
MDRLNRDSWDVDEVDVTVETAIEREVAQVRGHAVEIAGVVAEDDDRDAFWGPFLFAGRIGRRHRRKFSDGVCDVEDELVVASDVMACEYVADVHGGVLACSFKVQESAAAGIGIRYGDVSAVPAGSAIGWNIRIAAVVCIKAMRYLDRGEGGDLIAVPDLPRTG